MSTLTRYLAEPPEPFSMRVGVVSVTSPLTVNVNGGDVLTPGRLASYTPAVGDVVALVRRGSTWLVLGEVVAG